MIAQMFQIQFLSAVVLAAALAFGVHMENEKKEQEQQQEQPQQGQEQKPDENVVWLSGTIKVRKP